MKLWLDDTFRSYFEAQTDLFDQIMNLDGEVYRQLEARSTLRFSKGGKFYFIKKHFGVGCGEILKNLLQLKKPVIGAQNEWQAIQKLSQLNVPTMEIVGYGERGVNPATKESFIITEELTQVESLEDLCADWLLYPPSVDFKWRLIEKVAMIMCTLHQHGVNHRDCYICHFLLDKTALKSQKIILYLIDLHRAQIRSQTPERWKIKDIAGLYFSSMDIGLTKRDCYRFLKIYFADSLRSILAKHKKFLTKVKHRGLKLYKKHQTVVVEKIHDIEKLKKIKYNHAKSFSIMFHGGQLICQKILRLMPEKRLVIFGSYQHQPVIAKLFFSNRAYQHMVREIHGSELLRQAEIVTPEVLYYGEAKIPGLFVVLFKYINTAVDINAIWKGNDKEKLKKLFLSMQDLSAQQHNKGIYHVDLHPGNFLIGAHKTFMVDAADVKGKIVAKGLAQAESIKNLVQLYAQLYLKYQDLILAAFKIYCQQRNWTYTIELENQMLAELFKMRHQRIQNTIVHCLRNCSDIIKEQSFNYLLLCQRNYYSTEMALFFNNPDEYIDKGIILKNGNTCTVAKVLIGDMRFVVKRYNIKNMLHYLKKCWRTSRAVKSWCNAHVLEVLGILSAKPIACYEKRKGWLRGKAYFVCEYLSGELLDKFMQEEMNVMRQYNAAEKIIELLNAFERVQLFHRDMKATNIIMMGEQPFIVDLDAIQFCQNKSLYAKKHSKDIQRFMQNWQANEAVEKLFVSLLQKGS